MEIAKLYLEYISLILSWPVMVAAMLLIFFCKFHSALDHLIRTLRIKSPTGYEIQSQQPSEIKDKDLPESITLSSEQLKETEQIIEDLEKKQKITQKERDELREQSPIVFREFIMGVEYHISIQLAYSFPLHSFFKDVNLSVAQWCFRCCDVCKPAYRIIPLPIILSPTPHLI